VTPAIAVVVVTHDSAGFVGDTLGALVPQLREDDELIVVDNGSSDATVATVRAAAPRARVVEQDNRGFAGGALAGAALAEAPLLLFLNPDARPTPGCLGALREVADSHPAWGAWQALVTMPGGAKINTAGNVTHFLGMGWAGRCGRPVAEAPGEPVEVSFGSGAALLVRREAWDAVGGFDERYFMYYEDIDLCLRANAHGVPTMIDAGWRVRHARGHSTSQRFGPAIQTSYRSGSLFHSQHGTPIAAYRAYVVADSLLRALAGVLRRTGRAGAYLTLARRAALDLVTRQPVG
jgi:GT2 family glycosyltransferase